MSPLSSDRSDVQRRTALRREVAELCSRESRRLFDSTVHVGLLGGDRDNFVVRARDLPALDAALRTEVLSLLLDGAPAAWRTAWVVRPGVPQLHDEDLAWLGAAGTAFGMHGRGLDGFYAVTRAGWLDVRTGECRTWEHRTS
jgi:hypothetical protein